MCFIVSLSMKLQGIFSSWKKLRNLENMMAIRPLLNKEEKLIPVTAVDVNTYILAYQLCVPQMKSHTALWHHEGEQIEGCCFMFHSYTLSKLNAKGHDVCTSKSVDQLKHWTPNNCGTITRLRALLMFINNIHV